MRLANTGAWQPGDDPGARRFHTIAIDRPMVLEGGGALRDITIAFQTWGTLDPDRANGVLVCHALTGDSDAADWWDGLVGPGRAIDTTRYFVVCANVLGGCQGTTGPSSRNPATGEPYGPDFPVVSIRDSVRAHAAVATHLGVHRWHAVIGGSMGGMQVLEWAVTYPDRVGAIVPIATCLQSTAQQIAIGAVGRRALCLDPGWHGGRYYDRPAGDGPQAGLAAARMMAQITYRTDHVFNDRFGRQAVDSLDTFSLDQRFEVERYLDYHGDKLVRRFDANSYLYLLKSMDLHDIGRGRGGLDAAVRRIAGIPTLAVGISTDTLYWPYQSRAIAERVGDAARYAELDSPHGHDAFLLETAQLERLITPFLDKPGGPP